MTSTNFKTICIDINTKGVCNLTLNRPKVHNAFDELMIEELTQALLSLQFVDSLRVLTIQGNGESFCAGADLNWMKRTAQFNEQKNIEDAKRLANMIRLLHKFPKPTVAIAHGSVFGGGVGMVACCDIAMAIDSTIFSLSEVKLGLIPAVISPYVVNAIGTRSAHRFFLTGERFDAYTAKRIGLIHECFGQEDFSDQKMRIVDELLSSAPGAQQISKSLIINELSKPINSNVLDTTARLIAQVRVSGEGREGVLAFLNKKSPSWRRN